MDITRELIGLTHRVILFRIVRGIEMGRLEEKLGRVAGIAQRVTTDLEQRADFVLDREPKIMARGKEIFDAKNSLLDDAEKGLDAVERALGLVSNDPLQTSGSSQEAGATASGEFRG